MNFRTDFFGRVLSEKFSSAQQSISPPSQATPQSSNDLIAVVRDLSRLSRFGANILDAHSCFIFLPGTIISELSPDTQGISGDSLYLIGSHSLSVAVIPGCTIRNDMGLIGWVSKNGRSIHVSPFERDSRVLGVYKEDQQLKSFIGIPVPLGQKDGSSICGVVACDSKKAFAFSKLQGKLLEELGEEVAGVVELHRTVAQSHSHSQSWDAFLKKGYELGDAVGHNAVEVLRARIANYQQLESIMGTPSAVQFVEQIYRLIGQALPPHYPLFKSPIGEIIIVVDNMMANVYENKILAIAAHTATKGKKAELEFRSRGFNHRVDKTFNLEKLVSDTSFEVPEVSEPHNPFHAKKVISFR